jgi:AcrR family transcriptional regulator
MGENGLTRREREKLKQRQEILDAALDLFSAKGYYNTSMHEIAEKAEFAIGTLYKFFQNKEDLYRALVRGLCDGYERAVNQAMEEAEDDVEKLRSYIRTKAEEFKKNLAFIRIFLAVQRRAGFNVRAGIDDELRSKHYSFLEKLAAIFDRGIRAGRFRPVLDPLRLAVALDSTFDGFFLVWYDYPDRHPYPDDPDEILDMFFKGILAS